MMIDGGLLLVLLILMSRPFGFPGYYLAPPAAFPRDDFFFFGGLFWTVS